MPIAGRCNWMIFMRSLLTQTIGGFSDLLWAQKPGPFPALCNAAAVPSSPSVLVELLIPRKAESCGNSAGEVTVESGMVPPDKFPLVSPGLYQKWEILFLTGRTARSKLLQPTWHFGKVPHSLREQSPEHLLLPSQSHGSRKDPVSAGWEREDQHNPRTAGFRFALC